jgi:hypothetical protein
MFLCFCKNINNKKINFMKTIFFFFALAASIAATATQPELRVYYTGNDEPAASAVYMPLAAGVANPADSVQSAAATPYPLDKTGKRCPLYLTGNDEPAASGFYIATDEEKIPLPHKERTTKTMNNEQ